MTFSEPNPRKRFLKYFWIGLGMLVLLPVGHLFFAFVEDNSYKYVIEPPDALNDASMLNLTVEVDIVELSSDLETTHKLLQDALKKSADTERAISIGGARHSMGRQSLNRGGIYIDTTGFKAMKLDEATNTLKVQSGARWKEVVALRDPPAIYLTDSSAC